MINIMIVKDMTNMPVRRRSPPSRPAPAEAAAAPAAPHPVRRVPIALARRFFQICTAAQAESLDGTDLAPLEYAVLAHLNNKTGQPDLDQITLATRMGVDRNNASLLVERLVSKGLLERRTDGHDRRARKLRLTAAGEKLQHRVGPIGLAGQARVLDVLAPPERKLLIDLLVRVVEGNRVLARPGAGRRKRGSAKSPIKSLTKSPIKSLTKSPPSNT
jgi:DNA-binding MarR family transcriptional regulator